MHVFRGDYYYFFFLAKETEENHRPVASLWQNISHSVVSSTPRHGRESNSVVKGTNYVSVFSLQILIVGDFRIIDGEKIRPRVRRPPVGSV